MAFIYLFCFTEISFSQVDLNYYLPEINYDADIPTPEEILSYQIGEWHLSHDQLVSTMKSLCESSDKCIYQEYGRTHENRPLVNLVISNPKNLKNLDKLVSQHAQLTDPQQSDKVKSAETPIIIYQGYSVHGNESSGANAAPLVAYYLLAGDSNMLDKLLNESIIIIDPCYNPDGLQRFSTWANSNKHKHPTTDPKSREFNEVWPGGRTNHYWFDLNRDWLFTIHPSSQARIENFHKWKPDILTDHHEMGSNSTFFFQPGVPSRTNPNTPPINQTLTEDIGAFHAASLDSIGSLYY
ncbi:M14 family zinc carboxypeptidase, partial [Saprospiraceae bacterium]|nr:M14 family zinc carboxypeptidase [Saprospiraceae bacterium]